MLSASLLVVVPALLPPLQDSSRQDPPHVVFVVGEGEYQSHMTMPALAQRLEDAFGWRTTVLIDEELHTGPDNHVAGLDALESADLVVLYLRFRQWPQEDLDALSAYVERGGAIAGFRTSTHAFRYDEDDERAPYNGFGADVLGAPWIRHYGHGASTDARVLDRSQADGILDGVPDTFHVRSWTYHVRPNHPPEDARVLVNGTPRLPNGREPGPNATNPVAWTRTTAAGGRVFMTTMGHPEDFRVEAFRRLVGNGMHWALGRATPDGTVADFPEVIHPDDRERRPDRNAPWRRMDYGPFLSTALSIGPDLPAVNKGIATRLRTATGAPTDLWAVFDTDLVAWRCAWKGDLALRGIVYDGPHGTFPQIEGDPLFRTRPLPTNADEDPRDEPWGPVPAKLARWSALHLDGDALVFEYTLNDERIRVRERVWAAEVGGAPAMVREISTMPLEATDARPTLRLYSPETSPRGVRAALASDDGSVRASLLDGGARVLLPASGTVRVMVTTGDFGGAVGVSTPALSVDESIERASPRWGEPHRTEGVLDERFEESKGARTIVQRAGRPARKVDIVKLPRTFALTGSEAVEGDHPRTITWTSTSDDSPGEVEEIGSRLAHWPVGWEDATYETNAVTGKADLRLDGVTWRRGIQGRALDFDGTAAAWPEGLEIDFAEQDLTVAAWIHTTGDGTVFAMAPPEGAWAPDGTTLFLRDGRLAFDVGWVGVVRGGPEIADGRWHHVAATWRHGTGEVRLFVDGERVAAKRLKLKGESGRDEFEPRFGWTNDNFPSVSRFSGYMEGLELFGEALSDERITPIAEASGEPFAWKILVHASAGAPGPLPSARFGEDAKPVFQLELPTSEIDATYIVEVRRGPRSVIEAWAGDVASTGGQGRPFRIDRITWPRENRHGSWMRFGAFDFVPDPDGSPTAAWITTWSGDVWRVDGLDEDLDELVWTRLATGLNQPMGIAATPAGPLVLGRDQITRVADRNGDGEGDTLVSFANSLRNSEHFHEPASGLCELPDGGFAFIKAARHAKHALHDHHGAVVRVSADGRSTEVLARGFRAPIGLTRLSDGTFIGSDQEGHWTPANRINLIRPSAESPGFHGNGWAARPSFDARERKGGEEVQPAWSGDLPYVPPLCWIHPSVDRSPSSQLELNHPAWGPLEGALVGLSYGTGEVYLILREDVTATDGSTISQGGIVKLGIQLPTGLLHGEVHPRTGDLYVCGLFGWSSDRTEPGGFYRVRPVPEAWSEALCVPVAMTTHADGLELTFAAPLERRAAEDVESWKVAAWDYRRSAGYGSPTFEVGGEREGRSRWPVEAATLSADGRRVRLVIGEFGPAMQVRIDWAPEGGVGATLHATVHVTPQD